MNYLETIKRSVLFIEENIEKKISVHDVAQQIAYSPFHFSRIFSGHTGISLGHYIKLRKFSIASIRLLQTNQEFIDISSFIGYGSYESFSREFKAIFGQPPFYFRKKECLPYLKSISLLDNQLLEHLTNKLDFRPTEITISDFQLLGSTVTTELKDNQLPKMWDTFNKKMKDELKKEITAIDAYAVCKSSNAILTTDGDSSFSQFIGYRKNEYFSNNSKELEQVNVKSGKYLVFKHNDTYHTLEMSYRYIWQIWMHSSSINYDASRESFEQHIKKTKSIHIYIPIK